MKRKTSDALTILDAEFGERAGYKEAVAEERIKSLAAIAIYEARTAAGLTQQQLAELVGTKQPVIARLEDADYDRHTLSMLQRIATALNRRVEVRFVPIEKAEEKETVSSVYRETGLAKP